MFLKVLSKENFIVLTKTYYYLPIIISYCLLTPVCKIRRVIVAINHSWSERRIMFVPPLLKFSHVLAVI